MTEVATGLVARLLAGHSVEIGAKHAAQLEAAGGRLPRSTSIAIAHFPNESMDQRVRAAKAVRRSGHVPVAHIAARRVTSEGELSSFLADLRREADVDRVFVIAGDPERPAGPYRDALALLERAGLARYGISHVGIAGYPDGHPRIPTPELWRAMREKVDAITAAGLEPEIVTQFSFDADAVLRWLLEVRGRGIVATVKIGVPGPISLPGLVYFAARSGVSASASALAKYGTSLTKVLGTVGPLPFLERLARGLTEREHGRTSLHFFTFGALMKTVDWVRTTSGGR